MSEWKLVPCTPTIDMIAEAECADDCYRIDRFGSDKAHLGPEVIYKAMLSASPAPAVTEEMVERAARAINPRAFWTAEEWIKKLPPPINASRTPHEIVAAHAGERDKVRATARAALAAALEVKGEG
jgi:hypothetical protein